ncbi:MAG TPA: diguanylate cyclase [Thermodesulfobacteriota bacterium]|nr:diguanylate cyclase [Thermodesulfobacteriota bacterium]
MEDRLKILLVEDDLSYAQLVQMILAKAKDASFEVEWKDRLQSALDRLSSEEYDLVLLDLSLPDSGGIDTFIKLHAQEPYAPVMLLTGTDDETLALKAVQMGAQDYLVKGDVDSKHLVRSILYAIQRHRAQINEQRQNLWSKENNLRNVIERNADGIVIVDKDGMILYANPAAEVLFSRSKEELMGEVFGFPLEINEKTQVNIVNKDGSKLVAEMQVVKIKWDGKTAHLASLRDITDYKRNEEALRNQSLTDELTGLYNRRGFLTLAERYLDSIKGTDERFLVYFLDMDGLKQINDTFGHKEGNQALMEIAQVLRQTFRTSDITARLGGDEFVVLVKDVSKDCAEIISRALHSSLEAVNAKGNRPYKLSASIGVTCYDPNQPSSIEELLIRADELMYSNKQNKKAISAPRSSYPVLAKAQSR